MNKYFKLSDIPVNHRYSLELARFFAANKEENISWSEATLASIKKWQAVARNEYNSFGASSCALCTKAICIASKYPISDDCDYCVLSHKCLEFDSPYHETTKKLTFGEESHMSCLPMLSELYKTYFEQMKKEKLSALAIKSQKK